MAESHQVVVGTGSRPADDGLRLPRPPGVLRRFWARHPLGADVLIALVALVLTVPAVTFRGPAGSALADWQIWLAVVLAVCGAAALVLRRRFPLAVFAVALVPVVVLPPALVPVAHLLLAFGLYAIAVYRSARACWIAFGVGTLLVAVAGAGAVLTGADTLGFGIANAVFAVAIMLIGALIGVNVGNRRRYLEALIDRSRQLLVERDQQAQLAAAAERTRIAREMHDIVSHSLTVVVALADGASTTKDPARAAEATRAIAETARTALGEMRVMLGVLRDDDPAPLAPVGESTVHDIVAGARATGAPVTLSVTGAPHETPAVRLAVLRIVAEGLTNALRYAQHPTRVHVDVVHDQDAVEVAVENDGSHPGTASQGAGLGLRGLEERVAHVGGSVEAGFVRAGVWRLRARIPTEAQHD